MSFDSLNSFSTYSLHASSIISSKSSPINLTPYFISITWLTERPYMINIKSGSSSFLLIICSSSAVGSFLSLSSR